MNNYPYQNPYPQWGPYGDPYQRLRKRERHSLWVDSNIIGGAILAMQIVSFLVGMVYSTVLLALGHFNSQGTGSIYVVDDALMYVVFSPLSFVLCFGLFSLFTKRRVGELISFKRPRMPQAVFLVMACFAVFAVGNWVANWTVSLLNMVGLNPALPETTSATTPMELAVSLLMTAAVPALCEEFAFRGIVLGLLKRFGNLFAVMVSSLLFALMHGNFVQIPFAFLVGLGLGYITVVSGSIWPAIAAHFLNNAFSCLLDYFIPDSMPMELQGLIGLAYYAFLIVVGLIGIGVLLVKKQGSFPREEAYRGCLTAGQRTGAVFSSPTILIAVLLLLFTSVTNMLL